MILRIVHCCTGVRALHTSYMQRAVLKKGIKRELKGNKKGIKKESCYTLHLLRWCAGVDLIHAAIGFAWVQYIF